MFTYTSNIIHYIKRDYNIKWWKKRIKRRISSLPFFIQNVILLDKNEHYSKYGTANAQIFVVEGIVLK